MALKHVDLVTKEPRYHLLCYNHFNPPVGPSSKSGTEKALYLAHENVFKYICGYIEDSIIHGCNVKRITMLKDKYLSYMYENDLEFYNSHYKSDKLKDIAAERACYLTYEKLDTNLKHLLITKVIENIKSYEEEVRCGLLGKTGIAWLQFMEKIFLLV